ncbi:uncharacterized protein KD926_006218 [Aspergillus affinis]|uniref:uncharacterized protein n=1 Tax=Aspergillus affinis TaxID=1070780 RepID=UPI0022FE54FE|nr:uncharacterized protein KD926_006218 [Aspergillus affinis]KAI9042094.1 hypothetical protein KD926_006218 [Aspergillus affinis]
MPVESSNDVMDRIDHRAQRESWNANRIWHCPFGFFVASLAGGDRREGAKQRWALTGRLAFLGPPDKRSAADWRDSV